MPYTKTFSVTVELQYFESGGGGGGLVYQLLKVRGPKTPFSQ